LGCSGFVAGPGKGSRRKKKKIRPPGEEEDLDGVAGTLANEKKANPDNNWGFVNGLGSGKKGKRILGKVKGTVSGKG